MNSRLLDDASAQQAPLLDIRGLRTYFNTEAGVAKAVDGIDLSVYPGEVVGLVGESGSGKSVTALSILRLIPSPPGRIVAGEIMFKGRNLLHEKTSKQEAFNRGVEMLQLVGISDASARMKQYPHQFSGGQRQRIMIAMALALTPDLLIADEPTTALDVTIQAQILDLMLEMKARQKDAAILLITHNLAVVAEMCDRVAVMYGGKIQELAPVKAIFSNPMHPYTRGLLGSLPRVDGPRAERLITIPGSVPDILDLPKGCKFTTRCPDRFEPCPDIEPALVERAPGHFVRCHLYGLTDEPAFAPSGASARPA